MSQVGLYKAKRPTKAKPKRQVWQLRWRGTDGKFYCETIGDSPKMSKRDAERVRRKKQSEIDAGTVPVDKPEAMTIERFLSQDRDAIRGDVAQATVVEHKTSSDHAIVTIGKARKLISITPADVGRLKSDLRSAGKSEATVAKVMRTLRAAFNRAKRQRLITSNPFAGQANYRSQSRPKRIYSPTELQAMIDVAPDLWWKTFIRLAATTGLRRSEVMNLLWRDIDFDARSITVSRKDRDSFTHQGEEYPVLPWETKSHTERTVPVPDSSLLALRRLQMKSDGSQYVFVSLARLREIMPRLVNGRPATKFCLAGRPTAAFERIQTAARAKIAEGRGVKVEDIEWPHGTLHDLRRTYGTHVAKSKPIQVVRELMGHSTITVTADYYLGVTAEDADAVRSALDGMFTAEVCAPVARDAAAAG